MVFQCGGEPSTIHYEDHDGTSLNFKGDSKLYVNRVRNVILILRKMSMP